MDTCILIPEEFGLVLTLHPNPANVLEMSVAIWSNGFISPGTVFYPDQGKLRMEKLEIYSELPSDDIRYDFGCQDDILKIENRNIRHCNWVRFIKSSETIENANIIATKVNNKTTFQTLKTIKPNDEIIVHFTSNKSNQETEMDDEDSSVSEDEEIDVVDVGPDDVKEEPAQEFNSSTESTRSEKLFFTSPTLSSRILASPITPTTRDDDCRSNVSDVISGSDDQSSIKLECSESDVNSSPEQLVPAHRPIKRNRERTWLPCEVCGKRFDRPSLLKRHMRTHTGEKPHACDVCGKAFSTSSSLNTHRRIHSGEKPHVCKVCGKRFTASSNLYYHRMTHDKEKPHKCSLCSKSFPTPGDLRSHMYVHNGSWPFKCEICHRGFSKQTNLKNHLLLHSGDKPHECVLCGKKFALQCNLKTHMKTHEASELHDDCIKCGKSFIPSLDQNSPKRVCHQCLRKRPDDSENDSKPKRNTDFSISRLTETTPRKESRQEKDKQRRPSFSSPEYLHSSPYSPKHFPPQPFLHSYLSPLQPNNVIRNSVHFPQSMSPFSPIIYPARPTDNQSFSKSIFDSSVITGSDAIYPRLPWTGSLSHGFT